MSGWWRGSDALGEPLPACARVQCHHYESLGTFGEPVKLPDAIPEVAKQHMKVVTAVDMLAANVVDLEGELVSPASMVRLLPGAVLVHWYYGNGDQFPGTGIAWQLREDGTWPDAPFAIHAGREWFRELRRPIALAVIKTPPCTLCPPDGEPDDLPAEEAEADHEAPDDDPAIE